MEILYLYVKKYKALENAEFNFSREYTFSYNKDTYEFEAKKQEDPLGKDFFGKKINSLNVLVGKNGSGKSTVLELIGDLLDNMKAYQPAPYIIAYRLKYEEDINEIYIDSEGLNFESKNLEMEGLTPPKKDNTFRFNGGVLGKRKVIYYSGLYDGGSSPSTSLIDISTNKFVEDCLEGEEIKSYQVEELQRTISYFAKSPKFIDDSIKIPNYLSLRKNILLEAVAHPDSTNEMDKIIEWTKSKIAIADNSLVWNFVLSYFHQVYISPKVEKVYPILPEEKTSSIIMGEIDSNLTKKQLSEFLEHYSQRLNLFHTAHINEAIKSILSILWGKNIKEFENIPVAQHDSNPTKSLIADLATLKLTSYFPFTFHWHYEVDGPDVHLSSGEKAFYALFSRLSSDLLVPRRKECSYILLLDEPTLTMHPQWKKGFIKNLLDQLTKIFSNADDFSIQVFVTTHSPFIVSDLPSVNVSYLGFDKLKPKTFAANIHELLSDSFFMKDGLVGDFAKGKVLEVIDHLRSDKKTKKVKSKFTSDYTYSIIDMIGEPTVRGKLLDEYLRIYEIQGSDRIAKLQREIDNIRTEN